MSKRPAIITAGLCATLLGLALVAWATAARRDQRVPRAPITSESS